MSFKDISYLELWLPFVQQSDTIRTIGPVVHVEMVFKRFLGALIFGGAEPFMQILVEGIMGNILVKLF